jgi:hypothetical protein
MLSEYMFLAKCFFLVCDQEMDEPQFTSPWKGKKSLLQITIVFNLVVQMNT